MSFLLVAIVFYLLGSLTAWLCWKTAGYLRNSTEMMAVIVGRKGKDCKEHRPGWWITPGFPYGPVCSACDRRLQCPWAYHSYNQPGVTPEIDCKLVMEEAKERYGSMSRSSTILAAENLRLGYPVNPVPKKS